jgi:hypothetical protein
MVQMARSRGAHVIATVRSDAGEARRLGAKEVEALLGISGQATAIQLDARAARPSTVMPGWTSSFSMRGTG